MPEGNKTEKATPKRRRDERKKGNVSISKDAISVLTLLATFFVLKLLAQDIVNQFDQFFALCMSYMADLRIGQATAALNDIIKTGLIVFAKSVGIIMAVEIIIALGSTFFQTKLLFALDSLKPKFSRINPIEGFKRLFSLRSVVEALKGLLKIAIILFIMYRFISGMIGTFFNYVNMDLNAVCQNLFDSTFEMITQIILAFFILAAFDFFYQRWEYENKMKMTKQEVKEEYKQVEGDPKIKAKIKETQMKMAKSRMMQSVPSADVVIRNPQHVAIALRYKPDEDNAPFVLAKGLDELALRIVKLAEEHQIAIIENIPLARALYAEAELNQEIPTELYAAVADVLVYLYRIGSEKKQ